MGRVSPKKFLQFITVEHAKQVLALRGPSLVDVASSVGLSGTGRLHDLFGTIEGMTPGEYNNGGENLVVNHGFYDTVFGKIVAASTHKGICYLAFEDDEMVAIATLQSRFPKAEIHLREDALQKQALACFDSRALSSAPVRLHLKGTDFQLKVWEALLTIPESKLITYGALAKQVGNANASRAIGSAVGDNPVAYLIPCHRVIQSTAVFGQYRWGSVRKTAMIGWEGAQLIR